MKAKEYLLDAVGNLAKKYPNVKFILGRDNMAEAFIVLVSPKAQYLENKILENDWVNIAIAFDNIYESEIVCFINESGTLDTDVIFNKWNNHDVAHPIPNSYFAGLIQQNEYASIGHYKQPSKYQTRRLYLPTYHSLSSYSYVGEGVGINVNIPMSETNILAITIPKDAQITTLSLTDESGLAA